MSGTDDRRDEDGTMTLREAARCTGLSATTLRRYIKGSRLRARLVAGRYGPEYVVTEEDLAAAGVSLRDALPARTAAEAAPAAPVARVPAVAPPAAVIASQHDLVPGLLYRELLMKHEQLLVRFGMLRVSGQHVFESRDEAYADAADAHARAEELSRLRDEHAREIGELQTELRRAELEIAARTDEVREAERTIRRLEMELRNVRRADDIDRAFARSLPEADGQSASPLGGLVSRPAREAEH